MKSIIMSKEFLIGTAVGFLVLPRLINFVQQKVAAPKPSASAN